jgi:DNA-binding NtrC family response regulator
MGLGMSSSSHAVVSLGQPVVDAEPTPEPQPALAAVAAVPVNLPVDLPTMLRQLEDAYIRAALTRTQFNKKEAAKLLGMGRTTLVEKLRRRNLAARSA